MPIAAIGGYSIVSDAAPNDSDKTLTVPAGAQWQLRSIYAQLVSTGTAGNRQVDVLITDGDDNPFFRFKAGAVQTATQTREYIFSEGNPQDTGFTGNTMLRALAANLILQAGWKLRIFDSAAIDAAADDLTIRVLVQARSG